MICEGMKERMFVFRENGHKKYIYTMYIYRKGGLKMADGGFERGMTEA